MRLRRLVVGATVAIGGAVTVPVAQAQDQVTVPTVPGETRTVTWEGTVLPGANPATECGPTDIGADSHEVDIALPEGTYDQVSVSATATISYDGPNDLIVTIVSPDGTTVSGDSGFVDTDESASVANPPAGRYTILAPLRIATVMVADP